LTLRKQDFSPIRGPVGVDHPGVCEKKKKSKGDVEVSHGPKGEATSLEYERPSSLALQASCIQQAERQD